MKNKTKVFMTGCTGVMGYESLKEFSKHLDEFELRLLARPSKKNIKKLKPYIGVEGITITWGDFMYKDQLREAIGDAEYVLHIGGMVSPKADHYPEKTLKVNIGGARNIVEVIKERQDRDNVKLVYIGSIAQTSLRYEPHHWGRTGDPIVAAVYDTYAISKITAERVVCESGLKHWVSLRQSGILDKGLIFKGSDPISFHVPLRGTLEWATVEDSARLMVNVCRKEVPESFWRNFYNIGSGAEYRLTNYEFECLLLDALGCPPPEKVFETNWFATRNFHGEWYEDSDKLEEIVPFRLNVPVKQYFKNMSKLMPWWMNLTPLAPAFVIKEAMRFVAKTKGLGPIDWLRRNDCEDRIKEFFGSREKQAAIPGWDKIDLSRPSDEIVRLNHGYDETKPESELCLEDMQEAAKFRGGLCLSEDMTPGDLDTPLEWQCAFGHKFTASPRLILKGGHWCPECLPSPWNYYEEAKVNPFLAQVWYDSHDIDE